MGPARRDAQSACSSQWHSPGDWFSSVLDQLAPADVAACRLVTRAWQAQVRLSLCSLCVGCDATRKPGAAGRALAQFPHLLSLQLMLTNTCSISDMALAGLLPGRPPWPLQSLALEYPDRDRGLLRGLCDATLRTLGGSLPALTRLSLTGFNAVYMSSSGWQHFGKLASLELEDFSLGHLGSIHDGGQQGSGGDSSSSLGPQGAQAGGVRISAIMRALQPLAPSLRRLVLAGRNGVCGNDGRGIALTDKALLLVGISQLALLDTLVVEGDLCMPPGVWAEVVALPRLQRLSFCRSAWAGLERRGEALTDRSLAHLADSAPQLQLVALGGHLHISDAGIGHIARLTNLRELDLRMDVPARQQQHGVTDEGLGQLSGLRSLQALRLYGCPLGKHGCGAVATLLGLTRLQLRACEDLDDHALHRLSTLRGLASLTLADCPRMSDIGLSFMLKHVTRLTLLDLSGNPKNLTDVGLASIQRARNLVHLSLTHCQGLTEPGLAPVLGALQGLAYLSLRDCPRLSSGVCSLLAAYCPLLECLDLEHCSGVGEAGLAALSRLRRLHVLRIHGAGVSRQALAVLRASKIGRPLRVEDAKYRWWVAAED
ncbi:hypothetical protein N2152v2_006973 [Parachlorella kessleri]